MPKRDGLPFPVLLLSLVGGLALLGLALASALFPVGIDGRPDDVILDFGGPREGGGCAARKLDQYAGQKVDHLAGCLFYASDLAIVKLTPSLSS